MTINPDMLNWLLEGEPWVVYRTRLDLLGQSAGDPQTQAARQAMLEHPLIQGLLARLEDWPATLLNSHKAAGHPLHILAFLADLGLSINDPGMAEITARILAHQSPQGPFQVLMNISPSYGGSGQDEYAWALCDAPTVTASLVRLGLGADPGVQRSVEHLTGLVRENGWPCAVSPEMGKWRGPGKKDDPCPYANLVMLKLLAQIPAYRDSQAARQGCETLLNLWECSQESHPYIFYMGTDFRKLKAPLVWYDILNVLDALSQFPWLRGDRRLLEMAVIVQAKADAQGRFTPESIWTTWKDWDFGQKKVPSRWLTLLAVRALQRLTN